MTERYAPPRPRLSLCVGVSGHRHLESDARGRIATCIDALLGSLAQMVGEIAAAHADVFDPVPPKLTLLSELALGADQIAARAALSRGFTLEAVLPFARDEFIQDFATGAEREDFETLLAQSRWWNLPGERAQAGRAYAHAGEATVAQSDILIAIWDGANSRGPGGTGDVVDYAVRRGVPVIHVSADGEWQPCLLWAGIEQLPSPLLHKFDVPHAPADDALLRDVLGRLLAPPGDPLERGYLQAFLTEEEPRLRLRPEFSLLMALFGVRKLRRSSFVPDRFGHGEDADWRRFAEAAPTSATDPVSLRRLEAAFVWTDRLADHFAQIYRSASVFNFLGAAASVALVLVGMLLPHGRSWLQILELALIAGVVVNTQIGNRRQWHRRWLDYRQIAEELRTLRGLKYLSIATRRIETVESAAERRWTDFYIAAYWRDAGLPPSIADRAGLVALADHLAEHEVDGQIAYHRANARRMHLLDHRLHRFGTTLFQLTVLAGLIELGGWLFDVPLVHRHAGLITALTAILPTLGSAIFGIRGQGDFIGTAGRSARTAERLQRVSVNLRRRDVSLSDAARTLEDAAGTMLEDLGEWSAAYRHRTLAIPS